MQVRICLRVIFYFSIFQRTIKRYEKGKKIQKNVPNIVKRRQVQQQDVYLSHLIKKENKRKRRDKKPFVKCSKTKWEFSPQYLFLTYNVY